MITTILYALSVFGTAYALRSLRRNISNTTYVLPQSDPTPLLREAEVAAERAGYQYGPSLLGNSSFFPTGLLGGARVAADVAVFTKDAAYITLSIEKEKPPVEQAVTAVCSNPT